MTSRDAQDVILRLLADAPFRASALAGGESLPAELQSLLGRIDLQGLDRFGKFLCRHYYRERVVHYFKYSRALAPLSGRPPEAALKTPEFNAQMPELVLGERRSAARVLEILRRHLLAGEEAIRRKIPFWNDLVEYQSVFFLSDAAGESGDAPRYAARSQGTTILELACDLPPILPLLLKPFGELPMPARKPTRLLFARSEHGEVTVLRCTDALKDLMEGLTGEQEPSQIAARLGLDLDAFDKTLRRLEKMGAVVSRETFSSSHVGSEVGGPPMTRGR